MSQAVQQIELTGGEAGQSFHAEAIAAAASVVVPGDLVEIIAAGEIQEHSTAAANAQKAFALPNTTIGGTIDDAYAVGDSVLYGVFKTGQEVNARLAAGATAVVEGVALESAGDGTLRVLTADAATDQGQRDATVAYATQTLDNSGGGTVVRLTVRVA